jgi:hypothetical protein
MPPVDARRDESPTDHESEEEDGMSQRSVERALGKMITDETFRRKFLGDPEGTSLAAGLDLLPDELRALASVPRAVLAELEARLEDRICRLVIPDDPAHEERPR